jgi:chemotaxis protein CheX
MEQFILPLVTTCKEVFRDICRTDVDVGRAFFAVKDDPVSDCDISGVIKLSGGTSGAVAIALKDITAFTITSALTGKTYESLDDDVTDAVGELTNIIAGNVKKYFEEEMRTKLSTPSIVVHVKSLSAIVPWKAKRVLCIPFTGFSGQAFSLFAALETSL